jgi:hypothetical protein
VTNADLDTCFVVFSQVPAAGVDIAGWDAHAARFFRTRLSLVDVGDAPASTASTASAVRIAPEGKPASVRRVRGRQRDPRDLAAAEAADVGNSGLALLARRCGAVWLVEREAEDAPLAGDAALRLAAIVASVVLGPILDARVPELLGVKSARSRFESA